MSITSRLSHTSRGSHVSCKYLELGLWKVLCSMMIFFAKRTMVVTIPPADVKNALHSFSPSSMSLTSMTAQSTSP